MWAADKKGFEWPDWVTEGALIFGVLCLLVSAVLWAHIGLAWYLQRGKAGGQPNENGRFNLSNQKKLVDALKALATEFTGVNISFANIIHKKPAEHLESIFKLAGWKTQIGTLPLEYGHPQTLIEGIEIYGFNSMLLDAVCDALHRAGVRNFNKTLRTHQIPPTNPKHPYSEQSIYITLGHKRSAHRLRPSPCWR